MSVQWFIITKKWGQKVNTRICYVIGASRDGIILPIHQSKDSDLIFIDALKNCNGP